MTMISVPKVSVLIPTYNYARFLPEAIESVLQQDFGDFELILSDDCSKDNSAKVLYEYAARDPRIRVQIHAPNLGMVANWNWCLQQASGEYVKFLFGDDCLAAPHALSRMVSLLDQHPDASMATSARFTIDDASTITGVWDELWSDGIHDGLETIVRCLKQSSNLIGEPSVVLFRRILGQRGFSPHLRQIVDLEMWFHLLLQGPAIYTPEPLCCFRRHGDQQTVANRQTQAGDLEMVTILREYLPLLATKKPRLFGSFTRKHILFRTLVHLLKKNSDRPALALDVAWLRSQLPPVWRAFCWANYRHRRPVENFGRSARKRVLRQKILNGFAEQSAFLRRLRETAIAPRH